MTREGGGGGRAAQLLSTGSLLLNDGHLDLDGGVDVDRGDLLDDLSGRVQVDEALVDAHLEAVPGERGHTPHTVSTPHSAVREIACRFALIVLPERLEQTGVGIWLYSVASQIECESVVCVCTDQVLVPSPQGDLRVVMRSTLVGRRTGPACLRRLALAPLIRSSQTRNKQKEIDGSNNLSARIRRSVQASKSRMTDQ